MQWCSRTDASAARGSEPSQTAGCEQRRVCKAAAAENLQKQLASARFVLRQMANADSSQTLGRIKDVEK